MRLLGKMLRIDVNSQPGGQPYGDSDRQHVPVRIRAAMSTASGLQNCPEIYALGFRNPWRWSFDAPTGNLWVGDVGQGSFEEIDIVQRGGNYGWDDARGRALL